MDICFTYRHNSVSNPLSAFKVDEIYVFPTADAYQDFVDKCLDHMASEYLVLEGTWTDGRFTGHKVVE